MELVKIITKFIVLSVLLGSWVVSVFASDLPFRADYPDVKTIESDALKSGYDRNEFIIVDVRSALEYDVIRVKGAHHINLAEPDFVKHLQTLASQKPDRKIAVYCNGGTCLKSYLAAMDATEAGLDNVYAFDAGISAWSAAYPSETFLLGKELVDPGRQLIPESEFAKVTLDFMDFKKKAREEGYVVIDARDPLQRTRALPGLEKALPIPLDKLIRNIIDKNSLKDKRLLIFDQVGKQVRWLMYYLVNAGYTEYYFLKGGATSVLEEQEYR